MPKDRRRKVLLFYNPYSGRGLFTNNLDKIIEKIQDKGYQVVPVRAAKDNLINTAMSEMDQSLYRQVIVAGGDGTVNICINAMIENNIDLPLAIFPSGTANDFAGYLELPTTLDEMIDVAMSDHIVPIDLGKCNDKYFINVGALGNLVDVSQKTDPNLKNSLGIFAYYLKGASEIFSLKPLPVKLITPEKTYEEKMFFMIVMNGVSAGGFKQISPQSSVQDGKLNVILFRTVPFVKMGPLFLKALSGKHVKDKNVLTFETEDLIIESDEDISTDVDGEHGEKLPLHFSVLPGGIKLFLPKNVEKI
ncbi:MAG: YegS/Rv2252/BmrU family lipid kinase [Eubacteriales bacterium]|nr:YegS/Rv2252/BmrU family lipid kinase [Eubacteriales bacterium]MDY3333024.1 YegS/Rv2252/BmrU family lipid kinase [Gallibacter sp.]